MSEVYGFKEVTAKRLEQLAQMTPAPTQGRQGSWPSKGNAVGAWLCKAFGEIPGATQGSGADQSCSPGVGQAWLCRRDPETDELIIPNPGGSAVTATIYSLKLEAIPDKAFFFAVRDLAGTIWAIDPYDECLGGSFSGSGSGSDGDGSDGDGSGGDGSGGSGSEGACIKIPGVNFDTLEKVEAADFGLAVKDGCLVKIEIGDCDGSGS